MEPTRDKRPEGSPRLSLIIRPGIVSVIAGVLKTYLGKFAERYVGRVLEGAFLAPDIVEAILQGRQPPGLTFEKLCQPLPLSWVEQREQLGFPKLVFT